MFEYKYVDLLQMLGCRSDVELLVALYQERDGERIWEEAMICAMAEAEGLISHEEYVLLHGMCCS